MIEEGELEDHRVDESEESESKRQRGGGRQQQQKRQALKRKAAAVQKQQQKQRGAQPQKKAKKGADTEADSDADAEQKKPKRETKLIQDFYVYESGEEILQAFETPISEERSQGELEDLLKALPEEFGGVGLDDLLLLPANVMNQREMDKIRQLKQRYLESREIAKGALRNLLVSAQVGKQQRETKALKAEIEARKKKKAKKGKPAKEEEEEEEAAEEENAAEGQEGVGDFVVDGVEADE